MISNFSSHRLKVLEDLAEVVGMEATTNIARIARNANNANAISAWVKEAADEFFAAQDARNLGNERTWESRMIARQDARAEWEATGRLDRDLAQALGLVD